MLRELRASLLLLEVLALRLLLRSHNSMSHSSLIRLCHRRMPILVIWLRSRTTVSSRGVCMRRRFSLFLLLNMVLRRSRCILRCRECMVISLCNPSRYIRPHPCPGQPNIDFLPSRCTRCSRADHMMCTTPKMQLITTIERVMLMLMAREIMKLAERNRRWHLGLRGTGWSCGRKLYPLRSCVFQAQDVFGAQDPQICRRISIPCIKIHFPSETTAFPVLSTQCHTKMPIIHVRIFTIRNTDTEPSQHP